MRMKRTLTQSDKATTSPAKKAKTNEINNYFHKTLEESGMQLNHPPDKCKILQEPLLVIRNIKQNLEKHFEYPSNVSEFFNNLVKECEDLVVFKHYLFPNIVKVTEDESDEYRVNDSVFKILLSISIIQNNLIDYIFEKAIDLSAQNKCEPWIQMILKCFSTLESINDTEKLATHLIDLLDISSEKMVRLDIITAMPDIIGDKEHNNVAAELSRILSEDHDLTPAILECLSYLSLSDDQFEQLQKKTLHILLGLSKCSYFPNFVKFLLVPSRMNDDAYLEAVQGLRNSLVWSSSMGKSQEIASSQVLTANAIRNSMISSKVIANTWLKVISNCKINTDHKPIDIVILLILFSTSEEKQKQVENTFRKLIKLDILKEDLIDEVFDKFKPILRDHLKHMVELTNSLLKTTSDPIVESFASHMYTLMLSKLEDCCQTVVAELLQLGLDSKQCVTSILLILNTVSSKNMSLLKPQSIQMLTLLDRMDDMTLDEVRSVMDLLCGLAFTYENSVIRDDLQMIIRKELSSSNAKIKMQGVLAGIHAVKYLMATNINYDETAEMPENVSSFSITHLPEGELREAAQIIEMISTSTKRFPDMTAFFYDELSKVIANASTINKSFLSWLTDAVTNDLQSFIIDSSQIKEIEKLEFCMKYCLNSESEMEDVIAINIAELTLQPNNELCISILSPLFQLVQTLHSRSHDGDLSGIDAVLGCAIVMPKFDVDVIEDMDSNQVKNILDCLFHCSNWFRELLNAFATQQDNILKQKMLMRVTQLQEIEQTISTIQIKSKISYKPPISTFNIAKYTGELIERKPAKVQAKKMQKKNTTDDTVLPETSRTQITLPSNTIKNKLDAINSMEYRQLNLNLLKLLSMDMTSDKESELKLTVQTLNFILVAVNKNLENVLVSKIKRKTFLTKQEITVYDPKKAIKYADAVNNVLPKLMGHMQFITTYLNNQNDDTDICYDVEMIEYVSCLENIYNLFTIYFKWIGFKNSNGALLKSSLRTVANCDNVITALKDLVKAVAENFEKHEKYCFFLSTAVSLIELIKTFQGFTESTQVLKILRNMAQNFMSQQWKSHDGALEKGLLFNQRVDKLASIYFMNKEILALKTLTQQLTVEIQCLKTRNDTLNSLKCINKANFPILYRNLGTAVYEATRNYLTKGMTNSEHVELWKDIATIMKYMSDIAKTLENRNNLSVYFKKSLPILKLFISHGIPILELQFKNETQEVLDILKVLQVSTRFLQTLCCHSLLQKDMALMSKVPFMRQSLETIIYKVKAALAANNCSEAFWMGNLKNKNIHGEVIASQQSEESEDDAEDCDDQLPDDSRDSDEDMLNPDSRSISDIV